MLFLFSLFIDLLYLILSLITQIFNPNTELAMPIGISTIEAKKETGTHRVTLLAKMSNCSVLFRRVQTILCFLLIKSFWFYSSFKQFFIYIFQSKFLAYVFFNYIFLSSNYIFICYDMYYSSILLIAPRIFHISNDSFYLNVVSSLLLH